MLTEKVDGKRELTNPVKMSMMLQANRNSAMHGPIQCTFVKGAVQAKMNRDLSSSTMSVLNESIEIEPFTSDR